MGLTGVEWYGNKFGWFRRSCLDNIDIPVTWRGVPNLAKINLI